MQPKICEICGTRGWLIVTNDVHGVRVERCDMCQQMTDQEAWNEAGPFLTDLLMRFDQGTNFEKIETQL